jgi:hypothetical protein
MREIRTAGLMSGEGKQSAHATPRLMGGATRTSPSDSLRPRGGLHGFNDSEHWQVAENPVGTLNPV